MHFTRLGIFVSAALLIVTLGSSGSSKPASENQSQPDVLRVLDRGEGEEIYATFDRPMIEPEQLGSGAPLKVDLPGTAVWTGLSTATFRRQGTLPPSREVHARVSDIAALDGTRLPGVVSWSFKTAGLRAEGSLSSMTGTRPRFEFKFNRPVDPAEFARRAVIANFSRRVATRYTGHSIEVEETLPFDSTWILTIDGGLRAEDGAVIDNAVYHSFTVCPAPTLRSASGNSYINSANEITLKFSTPISEKDLRARLTVKPVVEFAISAWREEVTLSGPFSPSASYWIQIAQGVEDSYKNTLPPTTATVQIPAYPASIRFPERALYIERRAVGAVPLETVNVPFARLVVHRIASEPWKNEEGELLVNREFEANHEPNEVYTHGIPLSTPGRYLLEASAGELKLKETTTYQVTDLALTFKRGRSRSLACVTTFQDARPVADAEISLHDVKGTELWKGRTGQDGCAEAPGQAELPAPAIFLLARSAEDVASLSLSNHELSTWRLPVDHVRSDQPEPLDLYLITDRPLYRGGEIVNVKGWWRSPKDRTITLELHDGIGEVLHKATPRLTAAGGIDASFELPPGAHAGSYQILARVGSRTITKGFLVGYYRAPSFEVRVRPGIAYSFPQDRFEATVEGRTFFGAPLAGARVSWNTYFDGRHDHAEGTGVLDANGRLPISYKLGLSTGPLTLSATVTDAAHQSISTQCIVPVHASEVKVQARAEAGLPEAGKPFGLDLAVQKLDGSPAPRDISLRFLRRTWSTVQQLTAGHGWSYVYEKHDEVLAAEVVNSAHWSVTPTAPGPHVLEARTRDDAGREAITALDVYVVGAGEAVWQPRNDLCLELSPDRELYRVGETAKVLLRQAVSGSRALVTIEREGVLEHRWIEISGGAPVLELPIQPDHAPNICIGVLMITPRTKTSLGKDSEDHGGPQYRYGYARLKVDTTERRLPVEVKTVARSTPGAEIAVDISTAPQAEVTIAVVDQAVLSLVDSTDPDPNAFFWAPRALRVDTSEARSDLAVLRPLDVRGKKGRPGGGGGGPMIRRKFVGTAYWNPCVVAGEDGHARVSFKLPDNLTRWRVVVVATTGDRWGAGHTTFETQKPLMIVSALPRFALLGDAFTARVIVHNRTGGIGRANVVFDGAAREVEIKDGHSAPVEFPVRADQLGPRRFSIRATLGTHQDQLEIAIPIHYPAPTETELISGRSDGGTDLPFPSMENVQSVTLGLGLNDLVFMEAELRRLLEYPHGCVEQTTSKTLPLLVLRDLKVEGTDERIQAGVKRLLSMQTSSGGLSYWPGGSEPHPEGTVYATHALVLAERAGLPIPHPALERVLAFVEGYLRDSRGASRSYALYVLALAGRRHPAYLESLSPDPFLALAAIELGRPERARRILRGPVEISSRRIDAFDSDLRSSAAKIIARARLGEDPGIGAKDLLSRALVTYERAWTLLAMGEVVAASQEQGPRRLQVKVDGKIASETTITGLTRLELPPGHVSLAADGPVYYALQVKGQKKSPGQVDQGFWIRRTYHRVGETLPRLDFTTGDLVVVRVTVSSRSHRHYVALEDPLPAGFEPVDLRFRTEDRSQSTRNDFDFLEQRDDRVFASSQEVEPGIHELTYLARATSVGRFTAPASYVEEMYAPSVHGRGATAVILVNPR